MVRSTRELEEAVSQLNRQQLAEFREWFLAYDKDAWDEQMEADSNAGRLDKLAQQAMRDHLAGKSTPR